LVVSKQIVAISLDVSPALGTCSFLILGTDFNPQGKKHNPNRQSLTILITEKIE
jgi:hypothetical protein